MLRYILYPIFGTGVLGGYALMASTGVDVSSTTTHQSRMPVMAGQPVNYQAAPVVWRTGFHGPSAYRPSTSYSSGSSRRSSSGGVYYGGGYSGGK